MRREADNSRIAVRPYSKLDGTNVSGYSRANGNKKKIIREERKLRTDSKDLVRDTKDDDFGRAQFDLERIDTSSAALKPELPAAAKNYQVKAQNKATKQKARANKRARRQTKKELKQKQKNLKEKQKLGAMKNDTRVSSQQSAAATAFNPPPNGSPKFMSEEWKKQRLEENQASWKADEERRKREEGIKHDASQHNAKLGYEVTSVPEEQARKMQTDKDRKDAKDPKGAGYV